MCEFLLCLYIVSLHRLIKILIFHFIHKHQSAKCHQWWTWKAFRNRHAGGFFSLQSCTGLHCMEFARSPTRGDEGCQSWATSHRAAVCNPDCNRIWKNPLIYSKRIGPGTAHFPSQMRLSLFLFQHIWMPFPWELIVQILGRLLRISRCFYVSILANDLWDEL